MLWRAEHTLWGAAPPRQPQWSRPIQPQNAAPDCPLRFAGQWHDDESGLHYNLHRYYDPASGQYLSPDSIGLAGGLRTHAYVHDPLQWMDPLGLKGCTLTESNSLDYDFELRVSKNVYPETAGHIDDAIRAGKPDIITVDRNGAKDNRSISLKGVPTKPGKDRDEWPMAMFKEGGEGASVRHIDPSDNRGAGSSIGHVLKDLPEYSKIKIIIIP